jgi:Ca-activated chloride channel family protein
MCGKNLIGAVLVLLAAVLVAEGGSPGSRRVDGPDSENQDAGADGIPLAEVVASPASSEDQPWIIAKAVSPEYTIRRTVPEVRFQFSVSDEHGRLVNGLSADDIRIFDNERVVHRVRQFSRQADLPLQVGILLDVSDSVEKNILREKLAAQFFLRQVLRPPSDGAFLMAFSRDVKLWQASTGDTVVLRDAVESIRQPGFATTNLYDGLFSACLDQFPMITGREAGQRVILLFSDGNDTGSLHSMADAIALAERREVQIFALSVHQKRKSALGDNVLQRLADETGGRLYVANSDKELSSIFSDMEQQMRTEYTVSFQPQQGTPGFHALRLELAGPAKLRIRSRQGYYFDGP